MRKLMELNAPAAVVGDAAWSVFRLTLVTYGSAASRKMIEGIEESTLTALGICSHEGCTNRVTTGSSVCKTCLAKTLSEFSEEVPSA